MKVGSGLSLTIRSCGELDVVWTFPSYVCGCLSTPTMQYFELIILIAVLQLDRIWVERIATMISQSLSE
jgi:hypothetical protein